MAWGSHSVVYRFYDADCRLLYIGQSANFAMRIAGHKSATSFFKDIDTITVEHFDSNLDARAAEAKAIADERPLFNINHTGNSATRRTPRRRSEPVDESTWPTTGLIMNSSFFNCWVGYDGSRPTHNEIARKADVDLEWLMGIVNSRIAGTFEDMARLGRSIAAGGVTPGVAAMCPNRRPDIWRFPEELETVIASGYTVAAADEYILRTGMGNTPIEKYVPPGKRLMADGFTIEEVDA